MSIGDSSGQLNIDLKAWLGKEIVWSKADFAKLKATFDEHGHRLSPEERHILISHVKAIDVELQGELDEFWSKKFHARVRAADTPRQIESSMKSEPPMLAEALLRLFVKRNIHDAILGDLQEDFAKNLKTHGYRRARFMYWVETLRSMAPLVCSFAKRIGLFGFIAEMMRRFHIG
jgi:hypothetical protein